jgi:hypothetical protein
MRLEMEKKTTQKKAPAKRVNKKAEMLKALAECDGLVSEALKKCSATFGDHKVWLANDEEYKLRVEEIKEGVKDHFIRCAIDCAENGNAQVITNVLKTYCKDRGYGADGEAPSTNEVVMIGFVDED